MNASPPISEMSDTCLRTLVHCSNLSHFRHDCVNSIKVGCNRFPNIEKKNVGST